MQFVLPKFLFQDFFVFTAIPPQFTPRFDVQRPCVVHDVLFQKLFGTNLDALV
jgi:hypothetical protein